MLTHLDETGRLRMVDVTEKESSLRQATAAALVRMNPQAWTAVRDGLLKKGDLAAVVELAAIQAAKRSAELIPLTHPLCLSHVAAELDVSRPGLARVTVQVRCREATGVEMEALSGATVGALAVYDMIKALDPAARIEQAQVTAKSGGRSGDIMRPLLLARGHVLSLNRSEKKGVRKEALESVRLIRDQGMEGDAHAGGGDRQLSLLSSESVRRMAKAGVNTAPGDYGENVSFAGFGWEMIRIGDGLRIGECLLEISRIGKECHDGCWIRQQVGDCVMPREGFFARILQGGTVHRGDAIELLNPPLPPCP